MNDVLKIVRNFLRRYGYDINEYHQYNLLVIKEQDKHDQLNVLTEHREKINLKNTYTYKTYNCVKTFVKDSNQNTSVQRLRGTENTEEEKRYIMCLVKSVNNACEHGASLKFIVLDDHSDVVKLDSIRSICSKSTCDLEFRTTSNYGQGASLFEQFEYARNKNGLFYFCEDDYLHEETAIIEMINFYKQQLEKIGSHIVIHPQENEFLYNKQMYPSYLMLGDKRHWRTISHATHALFTHSKVVDKYWEYFENTKYVGNKRKRKLGSEARTTNNLFKHIPGFSPIPALAAHMQTEGVLPPFFDWHDLWKKNGE